MVAILSMLLDKYGLEGKLNAKDIKANGGSLIALLTKAVV